MSLKEEIACYIKNTDCRELADKLAIGICAIIERRVKEVMK